LITNVALNCKGRVVETFMDGLTISHREGAKLCFRICKVKESCKKAEVVIAVLREAEDVDFVQAIKASTVS